MPTKLVHIKIYICTSVVHKLSLTNLEYFYILHFLVVGNHFLGTMATAYYENHAFPVTIASIYHCHGNHFWLPFQKNSKYKISLIKSQ